MSEIKATLQNRVQIKTLNLKIKEIEREEILSLSKTNRYISLIIDDLQQVRASTGRSLLPDEKAQRKSSRSSFQSDSDNESIFEQNDTLNSKYFSNKRENILSEIKNSKEKLDYLQRDFRTISCGKPAFSYQIEDLKKKDPIFCKRYKRLELTKQYGRIPIFNDYDNKIQVNLPKCVLEKKKKELIKISSINLNRLNKENEARTLNERVAFFIKNYQLIT